MAPTGTVGLPSLPWTSSPAPSARPQGHPCLADTPPVRVTMTWTVAVSCPKPVTGSWCWGVWEKGEPFGLFPHILSCT